MDTPSEDKQWATKYLLDPLRLNPPKFDGETGHRSRSTSPVNQAASESKVPSVTASSKTPALTLYPTPPTSASPTRSTFHSSNPHSPSHRQEAFGIYSNSGPAGNKLDDPTENTKNRSRGSSLGERYPGDMSHRPLALLRKEAKAADRSPHLQKTHLPGADTIDSLDPSIFGVYHHEGPYDATLLSRNLNPYHSPVEALKYSNSEAIKATPKEKLMDSLQRHLPLQGTAVIPSGMVGPDGKKMHYEEGADLMRESDSPGGAYKRWDDIKYLPGDYKGKGEPSFLVEKSLHEHEQSHRRNFSDSVSSHQMQPKSSVHSSRQRSSSGSNERLMVPGGPGSSGLRYSQVDGDIRRSNTTGGRLGEGLKRRLGSLRRNKKTSEE